MAIRFRSAQALLQDRIDVEQWTSDVDYALRSIRLCGRFGCTGVHAGQLHRGAAAAAFVLDSEVDGILYSQGGHGTADRLREALALYRELLKDVKAELKDIGGVRQLRLALAEEGAHEAALAA